jgi:hypothetical protein
MNKGIRNASGEYCLFLNSGDCLLSPNTLCDVIKETQEYYADIYYSNSNQTDGIITIYPDILNTAHFEPGALNHQNTLIKRSLFSEHGLYNELHNIYSDWEFFLKELTLYKSVFFHIKNCIAIYDITGISTTNRRKYDHEIFIIYKNVFGDFADTIIECQKLKKGIYYDIITNWGNTKFLDFILKSYRYFIRLISK